MGPVATLGDLAPAPIIGPVHPNILANGRPTAMPGSFVTPHGPPPHIVSALLPAMASRVLMNGMMARSMGDLVSCGHSIVSGQPNILIQG